MPPIKSKYVQSLVSMDKVACIKSHEANCTNGSERIRGKEEFANAAEVIEGQKKEHHKEKWHLHKACNHNASRTMQAQQLAVKPHDAPHYPNLEMFKEVSVDLGADAAQRGYVPT
ncbi:hypothetical protein V8B97DRAFT_1921117 [Scleroderma yunnanense]